MEAGAETETELKVGRKNDWQWEPKRYGSGLKAEFRKHRNERSKGESKGELLGNVVGMSGSMIETCDEPGWRVNDILLAADVLRKVQPFPVYSDEAEMRRVFGLVYDVLRCKSTSVNHFSLQIPFLSRYLYTCTVTQTKEYLLALWRT